MLNASHAMPAPLDAWAQAGWLRPLDAAFARFLAHEVPQAPPTLLLAAALASHQLGRGHTCLDLEALVESPSATLGLTAPLDTLRPLTLAHWLQALDCPAVVGHGPGPQPLVLEQHRLYLRRHWTYEQAVREHLRQRMAAALPPMPELRGWLDTLFPPQGDDSPRPDWQKIACGVAAAQRFCLITGGPGTGKTTTVVRLLALLQVQALTRNPGQALRIRLAAPTGKAAARLSGSIASAVDRLPLQHLPKGENLRAALPTEVQTLHRLLGARPDSRRFRHHAGNPLPLDVLVVDEASMIDLEMMHAVLDALPATARVVLLGDKDQLASVEAGAVLGQLCRDADAGRYHPATAQWVHAHTGETLPPDMLDLDGPPLAQHVVMLRHSRRFGADSGIGLLAQQVNQGLASHSLQLLAQPPADIHHWRKAPEPLCLRGHHTEAPGYLAYLDVLHATQPALDAHDDAFDAWASQVLQAHQRFQVLCALREGPWGVTGLNRRIEHALQLAGAIDPRDTWYLGRPVLVTRNDPSVGLMNGDMGLVLQRPRPDGTGWLRRVAFAAPDGGAGVRWVLPSRLNAVETVYALTVHKSQGSEFDHVALVLPEQPSPVLTRELVYTGITRAKRCFTLVQPGPTSVWSGALQRRTQRAGALAQGL